MQKKKNKINREKIKEKKKANKCVKLKWKKKAFDLQTIRND